MIVHRVVMPVTEAVSWTVLGDDGEPVAAGGVVSGPSGGVGTLTGDGAGVRVRVEGVLRVPRRPRRGVGPGQRRGCRPVRRLVAGPGGQRGRARRRHGPPVGGDGQPLSRRGVRVLRPSRPQLVLVSGRSWWRGGAATVAATSRSCITSARPGRCRPGRSGWSCRPGCRAPCDPTRSPRSWPRATVCATGC